VFLSFAFSYLSTSIFESAHQFVPTLSAKMPESFEAPRIDNWLATQQTIIEHTWTCISQLVTNTDSDSSQSTEIAKTIARMALDYQYSDENFKDFISHFWLIILWLAKQLPPTSQIHGKIVAMLLELQKQPPPPLKPTQGQSWFIVWEGLAGITLAVFQYSYGAPSNPTYAERLGPRFANRQYDVISTALEWTSLNVFLAGRIHASCSMLDSLRGLSSQSTHPILPISRPGTRIETFPLECGRPLPWTNWVQQGALGFLEE
jgi:hypothetical protein